MVLDTQTLVVVAIVVALVPALMGAMVWHTMRTYPGRWVLGNFMAVAALILLRLRGTIPDFLSIVVANAFAMAAGIAYLQGIRRYRGLPIAWWPECSLGALGIAGLSFFRYASDNINARIFVMSLVLGSIGVACGATLLRSMPRQRRISYLLTGLAFMIGAFVHFMRGAYEFIYAPVSTVFERTPVNSIFFLLVAAGSLSWSLGFILLTGERLRTDEDEIVIPTARVTARLPLPLDLVPPAEVRLQMRKILNSEVFRRSPQMERFLTLVVERSFTGPPEELKEYALGRDVFHRGEDYDPRADSIVRVEAQRLRRKLREYYENHGAQDPIFIDLPAGSYVPIFRYISSDTSQLNR
jgi:hypothetical protein